MKATAHGNGLVDRAARRAFQEVTNPEPDLLLDGVPFTPALWHIVVEPLKPRTMSDGGIEVVDTSQEAESYQLTVGRVLSVGPSALDGKTASGIELKRFVPGVETAADLVGKFVMHKLHVGQILRLRKTDQIIKVMTITDLLGTTEDPYAWKFYI